jgi:hypothetical protein
LALLTVAQVREDVDDVGELLLEVALVVLQALDQLWPARETAAEESPRAVSPAMMMVMAMVHVFTSLPRIA